MNDLPKVAHPTARAFFDALDRYNQRQENDEPNNRVDEQAEPDAPKSRGPTMSEALKRKTQQLGWRNRHSQDEFYPITVQRASNGETSADHERETKEDSRPQQIQTTQPRRSRFRSRRFSVRQVQRGEVDGTYGTGATVWPAALVLIKYLERQDAENNSNDNDNDNDNDNNENNDTRVTVRGTHVLDLGAGTGVTSIAAALLGATSVVCTDGEESVVRLARDNIRRAARELRDSSSSASTTHQNEQTKTPANATKTDAEVEQGRQPSSSCNASDETMNSVVMRDENAIDPVTTIDGCPILTQKYWWGTGTSPSLVGCSENTIGSSSSNSIGKDFVESNTNNGLVILVADCVLPKLYPIAPLVQAIDECFRLRDDRSPSQSPSLSPSVAIVSYEHRYYPEYDPRTEFRRLASERCLDVVTVPREEMDPVYSVEDVELWIVRRRW